MRRRLAAGLLSAVAVVVLAPVAPARAALTTGTWTGPAAGATVSGQVALSFTTSATSVSFTVPGQTLPATIADGVATATWDTSGTANGPATLGASECDLTGCTTVPETVTLNDVVPFPTPADGTAIAPGTRVTVGRPGTDPFSVTWQTVNASGAVVVAPVTATKVVGSTTQVAPTPTGTQQLRLQAAITPACRSGAPCPPTINASWPITLGGPLTPPQVTITAAPKTFHPFVDGFADRLQVTVKADRPVTFRLGVRLHGHRTVFLGPAVKVGTADTTALISSIGRLPFGTYSWRVVATDDQGRQTVTQERTAIADAHRLRPATDVIDKPAAKVAYSDYSGACSAAHHTATDVVLHSRGRCLKTSGSADVALAGFYPALPAADRYRRVTLAITTTGGPAVVFVYKGGTQDVASKHELPEGTTTFTVPGSVVSPIKHQVQFDIGTAAGHLVHITEISISVTSLRLR